MTKIKITDSLNRERDEFAGSNMDCIDCFLYDGRWVHVIHSEPYTLYTYDKDGMTIKFIPPTSLMVKIKSFIRKIIRKEKKINWVKVIWE